MRVRDRGVRTLVGGVGYRYLRDFSVGPLLSDALAAESWPPNVVVEELSYGPVAVTQRLQEAEPPFGRLVVAGAVRRGRAPGAVTVYRWDGTLPPAEEIQERVAEAVTGVVHLDNLVVVCGALGPLPDEVVLVEVEPEVEAMGEEMTPAVRSGFQEALRRVRALAVGEEAPPPVKPLGGPGLSDGAASAASEGGSPARRRS